MFSKWFQVYILACIGTLIDYIDAYWCFTYFVSLLSMECKLSNRLAGEKTQKKKKLKKKLRVWAYPTQLTWLIDRVLCEETSMESINHVIMQ